MKPHTSDFKNAIKEMGRELRGVITYGNTTLEEEIMSITPHYEANILKSVMKQLDLELSVDIPLETVINCQIGILVNEEYEMLNFGNYVVYSSEKQEDTNTYKIVCYDKLLYSMKQNEDLGVTYPITIKNYLTALATKIGLTVASGTFYNQDLQIPSELYVGLDYTYRDILDEIAQATGSIITLNNNDEIEVRYPNDLGSTATVNGTNLTIAEHSNNIIVNAIISGNSVQDGTPTPASPIEIESSGDGINLLPNEATNQTINGLTFVVNEDKSITINGTATANTNYTLIGQSGVATEVLKLNANQNYYNTTSLRLVYRLVNGNYGAINSGAFTSSNDLSIRHIYLSIPSGTTYNNEVIYPQIIKGTSPKGYVPYGEGYINITISNSDNTQSQEFTIPCQEPMRSIGDVRDEFVKENGVWYEKHNLGEVVLGGTETWYMSNDGNFKRFSTLINTLEQFAGRKSNLLSNYFVGNTTGGIGNMYSYDKYVYLYPPSDITSIDSFKAWLSSNNTKVIYVLGTPNYIECTQEQTEAINTILNASLYTGVTNIVSNSYLSITYNSASEAIDEEYLKDVNIGFAEMYGPVNSIVLSRAGGSDNVYIQDEESVQENGLCEVKIADNQIMNFNNRSDYLQGLLAALDGLSYYKNDFNSTGILYYEVGDMYYVTIGDNAYKCLMLNDEINVTTGIEERIYTDLPEQSQTDYSKADKTDRRINQTYLIVDKQNQTIESVVNNVTEQNNKISQITQTVDEINSKIQDIADITTYGESQIAVVNLPEINESEPIMLKVRPITENISRLYPKGNLYPSSTQYLNTRIVNFKRTYTEEGVTKTEDIPYELPDDLLYYDSNYYDEFYLDYDSQTCQITKRCEWAGGVNNIINPADIINYSDIGGISSITYDETETFKVIFDNEDGGNIRVSRTYFEFQSDSITISLQNLVNVNIRMIIYYYNGDTMLGYRDFTGSIATIHNNDINGNIANRWQLYLLFYNVSVNQECRFNLMVNTGTTALPFETFNAIVAPKNQEQVIDYPYPAILLGDGDYEISLLGYDIGYLYVRLMAKNIYTTQFYTKVETDSRIDQKANEINLGVNQTLTNYSTTNQMNSAITIKANEINSTVSQKVGKNEVISSINQSAESVSINANKVNLAGKTINLTGDNIKIASTNFNVDKNGNMTCNNANITGTINSSSGKIGAFKIGSNSLTSDDGSSGAHMSLDANQITFSKRSGSSVYNLGQISVFSSNTNLNFLRSDGNKSKLYVDTVYAYDYETLSLAEKKKNFEKVTNALDIIKNTDIYKYNLKNEDDKTKKHIGFVIGNDFNYSKEITTQNNDGAELYSFISVCCQAIKEHQTEIEQMKKEIEKLKGGK